MLAILRERNSGGSQIPAHLIGKLIVAGLLFIIVFLSSPVALAEDCEMSGPQKLVIDYANDRLLVSNYYTTDITQVNTVHVESCFVEDGGFVDGMEIVGDIVYGVGFNRRVYGYNLNTMARTDSIWIPGSNYLSSMVADNSGHIYISVPYDHTILKLTVSDMSVTTFVGPGILTKPNGMIFQENENRLLVIEDRYHPSIYAISMADSSATLITTTNLQGGDGIAQDMDGNYYVTGYYLSGIYMFDSTFSQEPEMIFEGDYIVYPTYDERDNSLLVTSWATNGWIRVPLDTADVPESEPVPEKTFMLYRNQPNPFTDGTAIRFDLATRTHTQLDVYDVVGNQIRSLINETRGPGDYSVMWNGLNDMGKQAACGTYFFRLKVNGAEQTQRAVLMK